eukprot:766647-Hanusia_phi.AAC.1
MPAKEASELLPRSESSLSLRHFSVSQHLAVNKRKSLEKTKSLQHPVQFPLVVGRARENLNVSLPCEVLSPTLLQAILKSRGQQTQKLDSSHGSVTKRINKA